MYRTTDIILASYLRCEGFALIGIEKNDTKKCTFVFPDDVHDRVSEFDLGTAQVEPVEFNNYVKQLTTSARRA